MIGKTNKKPDVPATSKPLKCGKKECKEIAHSTISSTVEIMGKPVGVKIPLCPHHMTVALKEATSVEGGNDD